MKAMGQGINLPFSSDLIDLRVDLLSEELTEYIDEVQQVYRFIDLRQQPSNNLKAALTKELADILYVVYGFGLTFGLPLQEVFEEVHHSNMSKLGEDGKPIYREDGKVLKGPNYQPPELEKYFEIS